MWLAAGLWLALAVSAALAAGEERHIAPGPSPEVAAENTAELVEIGQIRVENRPGGAITVVSGGRQLTVGRVIRYVAKVDVTGFGASRWGRPSAVVATAVNAIHLKVGQNEAQDRGIVFSLLPREFSGETREPFEPPSPDASIYTDIPAGTSIFGGDDTPFVGNPVFLAQGEEVHPLPPSYVPARDDVLVISVRRPRYYPSQIVFENRFQGLIYLQYPNGYRKPIGQVLRPVSGVGRFPGGLYTGIGRLRANHPGVIDIKTSLPGEMGGFQIIPAGHAMSPELTYVSTAPQWMVVGALDAREPTWEGIAPLFLQYLRPRYNTADLYADDWEERLLGRFLVEVQIKGEWQAMPNLGLGTSATGPLPRWASTALRQVEAFRILFPLDGDRSPETAPQ